MDSAILCSDGVKRCKWAASVEAFIKYHDEEWGVPQSDGQFGLQDLFTAFPGESPNIATLTKNQLAEWYLLDSFGLSVDQKDWDDGSGDYAERVNIWGNTSFKINDGADFVIEQVVDSSGLVST